MAWHEAAVLRVCFALDGDEPNTLKVIGETPTLRANGSGKSKGKCWQSSGRPWQPSSLARASKGASHADVTSHFQVANNQSAVSVPALR